MLPDTCIYPLSIIVFYSAVVLTSVSYLQELEIAIAASDYLFFP